MTDEKMVCPICDASIKSEPLDISGSLAVQFLCLRCGNYELSRMLRTTLGDIVGADTYKKSLLSYSVRKMQRTGKIVQLENSLVENILKNSSLPKPSEQADNIVLWLGENIHDSGELALVGPKTHQSIAGVQTEEGFKFILDYLFDRKLVSGIRRQVVSVSVSENITLTMGGWEYYEKLKRGKSESNIAFMAMEYGHKDLDVIVSDYFKPAVDKTGFELQSLIDQPKVGIIDIRMRVEILKAKFLIADLTHDNNGAYWEAGFAEGLGKPVIYTCEIKRFKQKLPHFDTNHHYTVRWDKNNPMQAVEELKAIIRTTLPNEAKLTDD